MNKNDYYGVSSGISQQVREVVAEVDNCENQFTHYDLMEKRDRTQVTVVSREEWGASPPEESIIKTENLDKPARIIMIGSTYTDTCNNKEECSKVLKKLQEKHIKEGIHDILHNFMIADDGTVYEGRGWNKENFRTDEEGPMHKNTVNIAYIGKYREPNRMPNEKMLDAAFNLIRIGVEKGFIYKREEWGALPPAEADIPLKLPVKVILYPHTRTGKCQNRKLCINLVQDIQRRHMIAGNSDILYNFLIGGDGAVYEGRGFNTYGIKFTHKGGIYHKKLDIAFIGDFTLNDRQLASELMEETARLFVKKYKAEKMISKKCLELPVAYNERKLDMWEPFLDMDFPNLDRASG